MAEEEIKTTAVAETTEATAAPKTKAPKEYKGPRVEGEDF